MVDMMERWQKLVGSADLKKLHHTFGKFLVYTIRPNRSSRGRDSGSSVFEDPAVPLGTCHHMYGNFQEVPAGKGKLRSAFVFRLSNATVERNGITIGGKGAGQKIALDLGLTPDPSGKRGAFNPEDVKLKVALDMFEALVHGNVPIAGALRTSRILGTESEVSAFDRLMYAADNHEEWNLFPSPSAGLVDIVEENGEKIIRTTPLSDGLGELADEVPVLPGTLPAVAVGAVVAVGDPLLRVDPLALIDLPAEHREVLDFFVTQSVDRGEAPDVTPRAKLAVKGHQLFASPQGDLFEDIRDLVEADGAPRMQVVKWERVPLFDVGGLRFDARKTAFHWKYEKNFVALSPFETRRQLRQRFRRFGEGKALRILKGEALALPDEEYEKKFSHVLEMWPFKKTAGLTNFGRLQLEIKWSNLDVAGRAAATNAAIEALVVEVDETVVPQKEGAEA